MDVRNPSGALSSADVQTLVASGITTRVQGLRPQAIVRSKVWLKAASYAFAARILNHEPQRRRAIIHNIGTTSFQIQFKNTDNTDYNNPSSWTGAIVLAPGEQYVTTNTLTHFVRANTNGETFEMHIYSEAVSA